MREGNRKEHEMSGLREFYTFWRSEGLLGRPLEMRAVAKDDAQAVADMMGDLSWVRAGVRVGTSAEDVERSMWKKLTVLRAGVREWRS